MRRLHFHKRYRGDLEPLQAVYESVEETHRGLGRLALVEILCDAANKCLLVIGSSGTGKSAIMRSVYGKVKRNKMRYDALTLYGLRKLQKMLTNNRVSIFVDDLSKGLTEYSQLSTVLIMAELCYTGFFRKTTANLDLDITGFIGSAIINVQPKLFEKIIKAPEFETDIRDKAVRYYHLVFPVEENLDAPRIPIEWDYDYYDAIEIEASIRRLPMYRDALDNFRHEFTKARAREHLEDMLRASAVICGRTKVTKADVWLVRELSRNFRLELEIITKESLEGERILNADTLALLSAINTYRKPSITELCLRFQVKRARMYEILAEQGEYCYLVRNEGHVVPTERTVEILKEIGEL